MVTSEKPEQLARLHASLGYKPLSRAWAKAEIVLGLSAAGFGLLLGDWSVSQAGDGEWALAAATALMLFVLGGYLALAGHRSHLYQSNNESAALLLEEVRRLREETRAGQKAREES
jgi:hypothetical protein